METYLFVYGTLLKDVKNEMSQFLHANSLNIKEAFVYAQLFDLGDYPGVFLSNNKTDKVFGQVVKIKNEENVLKKLDIYEGVGHEFEYPNEYKRLNITAYLKDLTSINAWIYCYNHSLTNATKIASGNYLEYVLKV